MFCRTKNASEDCPSPARLLRAHPMIMPAVVQPREDRHRKENQRRKNQKSRMQMQTARYFLVARTRFELVISALRGRCPKPLDERAICSCVGFVNGWGGRSRTLTDGTRIRCPAIRRHPSAFLRASSTRCPQTQDQIVQASLNVCK